MRVVRRGGWSKAWISIVSGVVAMGCSDPEPTAPSVRLDFAASMRDAGDFYAAPFPSDHRLGDDGTVQVAAFPNPDSQPIVTKIVDALHDKSVGFGLTPAIFMSLESEPDVAVLPDIHASVKGDASVYLVAVDSDSPEFMRRHPIDVTYMPDAGPYGAKRTLVALPLQGKPLQPATRYAAVVTSALGLGKSPVLEELEAGSVPEGLQAAGLSTYQVAVEALRQEGLLTDAIALAAFTTADPVAELGTLNNHAHSLPTPEPEAPLEPAEVFDTFCVFHGEVDMPVYQTGEPPYSEEGGEIVVGPGGPSVDHYERARIVVTIPRADMPTGGWPTAVMIRTGGGGDRPLVDRGVRDESGEPVEPGTGPALEFAAAGFAGVTIDGPHGGIRNITMGDEQFLVFNFTNAYAMRDNIRQSAIEIALLPEMLDLLTVDSSGCADAPAMSSFDTSHLALFGHSMGASIAPLTLAASDRFGAVILSGAGGSWIENVVYKQSPIAVRPFAEVLVGYTGTEFSLHSHDPVLSMLQWAGEPADVPIYGSELQGVHTLMLQGIVDTYILPPIANATSLSMGLDLAGDELDRDHPELTEFRPLLDVMPLSGGEQLSFPVQGNRGETTAVVVQHPEGPIEDGHEVAFQTDFPKHQYRCFLKSWLDGMPRVVGADDSCD